MGMVHVGRGNLAAGQQVAEPLLADAELLPQLGVGAPGGRRQAEADVEVARDAMGRVVISLLRNVLPGRLDDLQAPRVAGIVRQLRHRVTLALCSTVLMAPIALWLLIRGMATYVATSQLECSGPLRVWLLGFLMLQLAWPICMPSLTVLLLGWCVGAVVLLREPQHCLQLWGFLAEALVLQVLQAAMLLVAAFAALTARPLVRRLGELLNHSGTDPDVVQHITVLLPDEVPADEECVICLSREDEDRALWRQLACGHRFHEPCVLEWLGKATCCPVCRLDLHQEYGRLVNRGNGTALPLR